MLPKCFFFGIQPKCSRNTVEKQSKYGRNTIETNLSTLYNLDVMINHKQLPAQSEISCMTGQCIPFRIEIINQSPAPLTNLILSLQFFQDYQNGTNKYQLETRVTLTGPNK